MTTSKLQIEINSLPLHLRQEVEDFVEFLKNKKFAEPIKTREFGFAKGKITLEEDFDEPLDLFKEYM